MIDPITTKHANELQARALGRGRKAPKQPNVVVGVDVVVVVDNEAPKTTILSLVGIVCARLMNM